MGGRGVEDSSTDGCSAKEKLRGGEDSGGPIENEGANLKSPTNGFSMAESLSVRDWRALEKTTAQRVLEAEEEAERGIGQGTASRESGVKNKRCGSHGVAESRNEKMQSRAVSHT